MNEKIKFMFTEDRKYLELEYDSKKEFLESEFDELPFKILNSNKIERVLPVNFLSTNNKYNISYDVEGLKTLNEAITENKNFTLHNFEHVIINVIQAIQDSTKNILIKENYLINMDSVMIDSKYYNVKLPYIPLKGNLELEPVHDQIKRLIFDSLKQVENIDERSYKAILDYLKQSEFNLKSLKELLVEIKEETPESYNNPNSEKGKVSEDNDVEYKIKKKRVFPPLSNREKFYMIVIDIVLIFLALGLLPTLATSFGAILVILTLNLAYIKYYRFTTKPEIVEEKVEKKKPRKKKAKVEDEEPKQLEPLFSEKVKNCTFEQWMDGMCLQSIVEESKENEEVSPVIQNETENESELPKIESFETTDQTILLDSPEEDYKFKRNIQLDTEEAALASIYSKEDNNKKIFIHEFPIEIGRTESNIKNIFDDQSISKSHAVIDLEEGQYTFKDLGSLNGTTMNGKKLDAYQITPIKSGDKFILGESEFVFEVSGETHETI